MKNNELHDIRSPDLEQILYFLVTLEHKVFPLRELCASFKKRQTFSIKVQAGFEKRVIESFFVTFAPRILSLVLSITALLADLGLADFLVGRTGFCIHPAGVVKSMAEVGGTEDVNLTKIRRLAPPHVIVNVDGNTRPTVQVLRELAPHVT
jgi:ABC-type hemin transport system substrate-binding protein